MATASSVVRHGTAYFATRADSNARRDASIITDATDPEEARTEGFQARPNR